MPSEILLANERARRVERALALTSLLARGSREHTGVVDLKLSREVANGLAYLEEELVEDLAELLRPPPASENR